MATIDSDLHRMALPGPTQKRAWVANRSTGSLDENAAPSMLSTPPPESDKGVSRAGVSAAPTAAPTTLLPSSLRVEVAAPFHAPPALRAPCLIATFFTRFSDFFRLSDFF